MARRRHHKAEGLSPRAQQLLEQGLLAGRTYDDLAQAIADQTGEKISPAAIGRYHTAKFRPKQAALATAQHMARELKELVSGSSLEEVLEAAEMKLAAGLYPVLEDMAKEDPTNAGFVYAGIAQRRLDQRKLALRERELELKTAKLEQERQVLELKLQDIRKRVEAVAAKPKKERTPADFERLVQQLYGIATVGEEKKA